MSDRVTLIIADGQYELRTPTSRGGEQRKFLNPDDVAAAFRNEPVDSGWIPPGVVRVGRVRGAAFAVGYFAPTRYACGFVQQEADPPGRIEALAIPIPALVLCGHGRKHAVWAVKGAAFDPAAPAFHAPLPNVYPDGSVCWGANKPPATSPRSIEAAYRLFVGTPFTQNLVDRKAASDRSDVRNVLRRLEGKETFPEKELVATGRSLGQVLDQFLKGRGVE